MFRAKDTGEEITFLKCSNCHSFSYRINKRDLSCTCDNCGVVKSLASRTELRRIVVKIINRENQT